MGIGTLGEGLTWQHRRTAGYASGRWTHTSQTAPWGDSMAVPQVGFQRSLATGLELLSD